MRIRNKILDLVAAVIIATSSGPALAEQKPAEKLDYANSVTVDLKTITYRVPENIEDEPIKSEMNGKGVVIGCDIITVDHVVSKYSEKLRSPMGMLFKYDIKRLGEVTYLNGSALEEIVNDKKTDIAVFRMNVEQCKKYGNKLTKADLLEKKDLSLMMKLWFSGSPNLRSGFYRESSIVNLTQPKDNGVVEKDTYYIMPAVEPGDSGNPVFSGKKIAGIAQYKLSSFGGIKFMDQYVPFLKNQEIAANPSK